MKVYVARLEFFFHFYMYKIDVLYVRHFKWLKEILILFTSLICVLSMPQSIIKIRYRNTYKGKTE